MWGGSSRPNRRLREVVWPKHPFRELILPKDLRKEFSDNRIISNGIKVGKISAIHEQITETTEGPKGFRFSMDDDQALMGEYNVATTYKTVMSIIVDDPSHDPGVPQFVSSEAWVDFLTIAIESPRGLADGLGVFSVVSYHPISYGLPSGGFPAIPEGFPKGSGWDGPWEDGSTNPFIGSLIWSGALSAVDISRPGIENPAAVVTGTATLEIARYREGDQLNAWLNMSNMTTEDSPNSPKRTYPDFGWGRDLTSEDAAAGRFRWPFTDTEQSGYSGRIYGPGHEEAGGTFTWKYTESQQDWLDRRGSNNWPSYVPTLSGVFSLKRTDN